MHSFDIVKPKSLADATSIFAAAEDAAYLAGGMTLIPSMKARLAAPKVLVDLSELPEMRGIVEQTDSLRIGAMTRTAEIYRSQIVRDCIPALAELAGEVADRHVRNRGTIGGSVANNDPAADYPAAILGLGATIVTDRRELAADDFFTGLFATALAEDEIIVSLLVPKPRAAAYAKHAHPASGYAVAGVFAARFHQGWRIAVTGSGADGVFRLPDLEGSLATGDVRTPWETFEVSRRMVLDDAAFPADFRRELIGWLAKDAVEQALS